MKQRQFAQELEDWSKSKGDKTLGSLLQVFSRDSFSILILLLMSIPALPVPTGGLTHIFEVITILLALEMIAGRHAVWLPERWRSVSLQAFASGKTIKRLVSGVRRLENLSRPRLAELMENRRFISLIGLIILIFAAAAFLAPPFSGLDTLPALGVVIISLALIFNDIVLLAAGTVVGLVGIGLIIALGSAIYHLF
ncbi:MAG TPA: exopolysaccharide biosynthesis protein [Patescibacteria group bacterium]|nr:exopolysaccharide biosynthesis protein [Patescibacteria group bacterium]